MATLLRHIKSWMQRSILESEQKMEHIMDWKIQVIHKCLDAFELRVLERTAPTIDVSTFQMELASLHANVDALFSSTHIVPETTSAIREDEVVMTALFSETMPPPNSSRVARKHHRSDHTSDTDEARILKKKDRQ
uniref:Integrase core domain containing protein n=1 Tax=Solanum tuberosum TaxID=4113 RepID=M1DNR8_SOLTU